MKISIALSVVILAIGLAAGLLHQKQLSALREDRHQLAAQAVKIGVPLASTDSTGEPKITKRQREDREKNTRSVATDLIAFAREIEQRDKGGNEADGEFQQRAMDLMGRMMALDPEQLKGAIAGLRADPGLSDETRRNMIGFSAMMLAENHPAAALALIGESADLMAESDVGQQAVITSLGKWSKDDPRAALKWIDENSQKHPELADNDTKCSVLAGAAETDPKLAFKLMGELKLDEMPGAIQAIVDAGKTPEQRAATLAAFREHLASVTDESQRDSLREEALGGLARTITGESFDSVTSWISKQKLTAEENDQFVGGISYDTTKDETGKWVEWMAQTLPADKLGERVGDLVGQWTQQDYQAAGKWLSAEPDGPAKNASVKSYAETVAEYDPQVATQWAMTLPAGEERDDTLKSIYENWPNKDAAGKAAFAAEHGIKPDPDDEAP
ncbi:MAG: hypothetical protein ABI162_20135 [Luteolibacter sp.]